MDENNATTSTDDKQKRKEKIYLAADPLQSKQVLTVAEAAYCLNRSRASLYDLLKRGELKSFRHFGKRLFHRDELLAYIDKMSGRSAAA